MRNLYTLKLLCISWHPAAQHLPNLKIFVCVAGTLATADAIWEDMLKAASQTAKLAL